MAARKRDLSQIVTETAPPATPEPLPTDTPETTPPAVDPAGQHADNHGPTREPSTEDTPPPRGKGRRPGDRRMTLDLPDTVHAELHRYALNTGLTLGRSIRPQHITRALVYTLLADTDLAHALSHKIDEDLRRGIGR